MIFLGILRFLRIFTNFFEISRDFYGFFEISADLYGIWDFAKRTKIYCVIYPSFTSFKKKIVLLKIV